MQDAATPQEALPWHALEATAALDRLATDRHGLSAAEAQSRLATYGPNRLPKAARRGPLIRFLAQFHNLLIYVLLAAAVVTVWLDHVSDALVILAVVLLNALIGFVQEGRAEKALDAIRGMIDPQATVLRDGHRHAIPADQIVPGDIVIVEAGDRIPADLRLIRARGLKIDEAVLTGESVAADKAVGPVGEGVALGDRHSMSYSGTFVAAGMGVGVVTATGARTELGHISTLIGRVETLKTPLIRQMDGFARHLTYAILAVSAAAFLFAHYLRGYSADDAFMTVVGLAVAAIPEGLPAIMTITLAIGVQRMAARNAIIRRLPAVETLGSVSVICTDKTGTLTRNEMMAQAIVTAGGECEVTGAGYSPHGDFRTMGSEIEPTRHPLLMELVRAALLCNDAEIREDSEGWHATGDPMEAALVALAAKAGLDTALVRKQFPRTDEIPFDAQHRFMATLHHSHEDDGFILIKGAPEDVIAMCALERHADGDKPLNRAAWHSGAEELAARGHRVLAFAVKPARQGQQDLSFGDVDSDAVLLGFVGFIDPPRSEAVKAIADCHRAGIRVAMITGDHAATAREIARQIGLSEHPKLLTGADIDKLDEKALIAAAHDACVFARTTPEHKLRLVSALQADGHIVSMTGDGVNDAPALTRADVGVAMGRKGSEAAKESAEMVLADDNFASIVAAVREGRTVYDNLMKVIAWTLPTNGGEALTILGALALGLTLPITPVQILWINMVTAVALGLTLAFEPTEEGTMRRPPRRPGQPILTGDLLWRVLFVSLLVVAGAFGLFYWAESQGRPVAEARTLAVNAIVAMEAFYLFSVRYAHGTAFTPRGFLGMPAILIGIATVAAAQAAFTYLPFLQAVFDTRPLSLLDGLAVIGVGVALLVATEAEKRVRFTVTRRQARERS
ncbi:HAD-IC family P-type ATPase [Oceanibaculum indicum]|uniref:P-type E1-E2 ATPase n=1 Tax=Oceanibaculum indicum TaxID=526216 RepID=A0A420WSL8_9PROT|nr:HAD-IC family P-type ATPase [Oceanibaculum indicum]RKQ73895.1 P-type E1-E2 ATPase [Oceanibaculum indicum]